jgi:hypothetical protein
VCVQILSTFGDLALVLGDNYEKYLETVKRMLSQAMHLSVIQVRPAHTSSSAVQLTQAATRSQLA